ncbi:hypothetical protein EV363DRAFT_1184913, partial [Boletus edulis]
PSDPTQRRTGPELLRYELGDRAPATAVPPTSVLCTPKLSPHGRTRCVMRLPIHAEPDLMCSLALSISSDQHTYG